MMNIMITVALDGGGQEVIFLMVFRNGNYLPVELQCLKSISDCKLQDISQLNGYSWFISIKILRKVTSWEAV